MSIPDNLIEMKTLTIGDKSYEVVDDSARSRLQNLEDKHTVGRYVEAGGEIFNNYTQNSITNEYDAKCPDYPERNAFAHAEGDQTIADWRSHAEGFLTKAIDASHAEGRLGQALGKSCHVEGGEYYTPIDGVYTCTTIALASGVNFTVAGEAPYITVDLAVGDFIALSTGVASSSIKMTDARRIEAISSRTIDDIIYYDITINAPFESLNYNTYRGEQYPETLPVGLLVQKAKYTAASGNYSHAEGRGNQAIGDSSHAEGGGSAAGHNIASGTGSHAEGYGLNVALGDGSHAEGRDNMASGFYSHAEGDDNVVSGVSAHAEGSKNTASGGYSHAEGYNTSATGAISHSEGHRVYAVGRGSHAEGYSDTVYAADAHGTSIEEIVATWSGLSTSDRFSLALGQGSHAEGRDCMALSGASHAEGYQCIASGSGAHAEGGTCTASGEVAHAEGQTCVASAARSHAEGSHTQAASANQHVQGKYNIVDTAGKYAHILGNGTSDTARSNAHTVDWKGNAWFAGTMTAGNGIVLVRGVNYGTQEELESISDPVEGQFFIIIEG